MSVIHNLHEFFTDDEVETSRVAGFKAYGLGMGEMLGYIIIFYNSQMIFSKR